MLIDISFKVVHKKKTIESNRNIHLLCIYTYIFPSSFACIDICGPKVLLLKHILTTTKKISTTITSKTETKIFFRNIYC